MGTLDKYLNSARNLAEDTGDKAKNKFQGVLQDARAGKEIRQGIDQLENLPEFDGSIVYKMELEAAVNSLSSLLLSINDSRLDNESVAEEIRKVMNKVQPSADSQEEATEEQQAIEGVKAIAYRSCKGALEALKVSADS